MRGQGGFEHNTQSLRVVEMLEIKYPKFAGLNLSFEVIEGLKKHQRFFDPPGAVGGDQYQCPSLEAQVANLADEITYYSHDLDDGIDSGLLDVGQLEKLMLWEQTASLVRAQFKKLRGQEFYRYVIRCLIDREVADVIKTSATAIAKSGVKTAEAVRRQERPLIRYSQELLKANRELRRYLYANMYFHPRVHEVQRTACAKLQRVFEAYLQCPSLLGARHARRTKKEGLHRTVCDYVSGMTDRYLMEEHERLFLDDQGFSRLRSDVSLGRYRMARRLVE